jgi:hypothetical protein
MYYIGKFGSDLEENNPRLDRLHVIRVLHVNSWGKNSIILTEISDIRKFERWRVKTMDLIPGEVRSLIPTRLAAKVLELCRADHRV